MTSKADILKVLIVNDYSLLEGGAERFIENMLLEASHLPLAFTRINMADLLQQKGHTLPMGKWKYRLCSIRLFPDIVNDLLNRIKSIRPDLIHLNTCHLYTRSVCRALRQSGIPVACFVHDYYTLRRLRSLWMRGESKTFIYLTHAQDIHARLLDEGLPSYLVRVPFNPSCWSGNSHDALDTYHFDLLYVGRLKREKGIFTLVQAVDLIRRQLPEISLAILGDGPCHHDLVADVRNRGLESNIKIKGRQPDTEIIKYYQNARLVVLPSRQETLGYVGLEAQASGIPVMAFRNSGTDRWCKDGINGFLVDTHTPEKLAEKMVEIIRDDVILRRISKTAREDIRLEAYNASQQPITDLYKAMLSW